VVGVLITKAYYSTNVRFESIRNKRKKDNANGWETVGWESRVVNTSYCISTNVVQEYNIHVYTNINIQILPLRVSNSSRAMSRGVQVGKLTLTQVHYGLQQLAIQTHAVLYSYGFVLINFIHRICTITWNKNVP
jgi:hypothetical protein